MAMHVKFPFGKLVSVLVTHVEASTGDFFVQINDEAGKLDALMVEIEQNVLSGRAKPPKASEIMVGRIYVVQYLEDSRWYRARVLGVNVAEQQCEVFFIDYGNTEFVSLSCIRNAEEKFCELPPQCFECELEGFDRFRGDRFDEMLTLLNDTILEQELYCKAIHLKKNCVLVAQLFVDDKGTQSVLDVMQNGGAGTTEDALSNGDVTMARQPSFKREVKYKVVTLPQDSFHDLSVTWVEDPSHFWCQLLSHAETLVQLMERIADVYANLDPSMLPLQSCTVGYPCCAKFYEDDAWYRGIITNVSSIVTGQIEVRFVDYGNTQNTELSDVRDLKDEFLKEPCHALYFAIAGVDPASKDGLWADEAKTLFEKLINYKHVVGLVTSVESDGRHRVKLMDTTSDLDMELNQILIAANYGVKSADSPTSRTFTAPTTAFKPSDPASKPAPQPVFSKEKIQIGVEEKVLVTNIITPGKFYCQLFRNGPRLENLMMEVARHYTKLGANEELLSSPSPGDPCCAQFTEDNCWYRAVVISTAPKGITVLYIDYGNSETVPASRIKKLIPKFSELPQQGIECTLNRIKPKFTGGAGESKWKSGDRQKFMDLALEMEGKMTVIAQDGSGICRVELVVRNRREEQNISEQLLIGGIAELADGALSASANFSNLKSQTFPEPDLEVGQFEDVIVSHIDHPCDFWCQLQKTAEQLDSLMHEISELYSSGGQRNSISNPACGMLCCAQFTEDDKWYRGKITGVQKGGQVEVHFVDYGNYELLPMSRVKRLQAEYLLLPPQAVKCALLKIDPLNKDLLSDDVMHRFEELTLDKELVMMADKHDKNSGTYEVVLLDTTEGKNLDVAKELQALMGPSTNQGAASIVGVAIQSGTTEQVFVSSATSPSKFSCQLMKTASSLDDLMNEMFDYYKQLGLQQEQMPKPSVGEFCAAKFTLDDGWYRGKVLSVQGDSISVLYIDYGNSETLSLSRLRALNSKFHSLPSQAIDCALSGNFGGISDTQFQEIVSEKEFTAKVLSVESGVAAVDLVSKETSQSVANMLGRESKSSASSACTIAYSDWKIGDILDIYVPFVESAQKFFCQASSHSSKLDDLMNKLEEYYKNNSENLTTILNGSCCVAMYSDGGWYRAKVEHVQGGEIKVNYIDYGDSAIVPISSIRTLMPEFSNLPAQAVQCCLKGFLLKTGPENFKDLVLEQEFKAQVVSAKSSGIYEVDLIPQDGSASISQVLSKDFETDSVSSLSVPSIQWELGDNVNVFVPFVESTQKFFCQVSEYASGLDDLMTKLEKHYGASQENVASVIAGMFCVAQYEDGGWYRAQVLHAQDKSVNVFYIDYGDSATLPLSSLRSLTPEFSSLPAQAVKCCLKGHSTNQGPENFKDLVTDQEFQAQVVSVKGQDTYEVDLVSSNDSTFISNKLLEGAETAEVSSCRIPSIQLKQGDQVEVFVSFVESAQKFFCQSSQSSSDLDDLMIRLEEYYTANKEAVTSISTGAFCVAQYEDGGWYRAQVTHVQGQSISVFYIDYGDSATLPLSSIRSMRPAFCSLPAQAVHCCLNGTPENLKDVVCEQEFVLHVVSNKQPGIYEVELTSKDGSVLFGDAPPSEIKMDTSLLDEITEGSSIQFCPTACVSPHLFHCQIATADHKERLEQLMNQLQDCYEVLGVQEQGISNPTVGMNCAAVFAGDGLWYRGTIVEVVDQQKVKVSFSDFGNIDTVPLSKLKAISADLLQLPPQVIQCGISSISPVGGAEWSDDSIERFCNLTMHKRLLGKVIKKESGNLEIELFDTSDSSEDINIGELLVKEGLAKQSSSAMKSLSVLGKACVSKNEKVYITAVESPESFYCQISGSEEKLTSLMGKISAIYDSMPADELKINTISEGDVCCAQFSEDNQWYRAVVEGVNASELTVRFIDYGNLETLNIDRTKVLNDDFFGDPPLAIKCCLHNLQPPAGQTWADEAGTFLEGLVSEKELDAQFLSFTEPFKIQLRDGTTDVQEELVKAGLAGIKSTVPGTTTAAEYIRPVLKSGETCGVCISHISSPGEFYCQLVNLQEQLDGMMNDLNSHYSQLSETESSIDSPVVGQSCVALYEGMWYRANILSFSENDFTVHYVDYGNEETLEHSAVKQISPLFLKTTQVAVKCSLDPNRGQWSEKATALFEDLTGEDELVIKIIGQKGDTYQVKVFSKDERCVSEEVYNTFSGEVQDLQRQKPVLPEMAVHSGLTEDIYVSHAKSSQAFYIQLSKTYDQLLHMMAELSRVNSSLPDDVHPPDLVVGTPICALFAEDEEWYRAVIESIPSEFEVGVHFVDYGNSDVVLLSDVRPLDKKFLNVPVQAVHCCLDSQVDADTFHQQVDGRELKATFMSLTETMQWQVSLSDKGGKLIRAKTKPKVQHPYIDEGPMLEDNSDTCQIREFTQLKIKPNVTNTVYVSHVVSPDEFYVQFESALDSLSILSEKMSTFYSKMQPSDSLLNDPCTGMSCCARFSEDGNWYRGKIREVGSHGALVQFIDYGNCEVVPFYNIKDTDKEFMQLPQQSTLCGLDATKDVWSPEEVNTLKTVALDKCFQAKFNIRDGLKWRVCLESNGVSVLDMFMGKVTEESSIQVGTYAPQKLSSSQVEEVFVSYVTESGDFFVQLSKTSPDLQSIEMLVSETYDQMGPTEDALEMCFVDSPCCAKFSQDFKWYRALVTRIFSEAEVEVLFVDYGNTDTLKVEAVKQIKSELLTFPVQAVKCRLEGSKDVWTDSDVQQFEASVMDKPLHVTFTRQQGDTWFVTIQELDLFSSKVTPKVKSFSKEVFDCNNREDAYFVCADSSDCIWLQPARTGEALIALMDQISNDVTGQQMDQSQLLPGVPCLGQFTDNDVWHRAQILDLQGNSSVTVFYVDYGNSETLTVDRLHPISDSHLKLPAQAIHCRLADLEGVDPTKVTEYLNEVLCEKPFKVEVQERHADSSYTVKLYEVGSELSVNEQVVGECLGDTSLIEEATLEQLTPPHPSAPGEKRSFKLPEVKKGTMLPVSFVSAFLPSKMQLLLSERIEERDKITNHVTSMYEALGEGELKLENPEVGVLCCVHFSPVQGEASKWYRGEVISISADDTATVKLVDYGTHEKIPISELRFLKDELLEMPVFILESSLAGIRPRSHDGQWSPECSSVLESFCHSKVLTANITEVYRDLVELILTSDDGKAVNESLVDLGYAEVCNIQEDFSLEEQQIKWPELQVEQCLDVFMMAVKDLQSIQLQLADSEAELTKMREQLTAVYSLLGEAEEVIGNPRVGQVCCAQFADDREWYRAVITCVSDTGIKVKFLDYGNMDVALSIKQLKEEFFILPVQCFECSLSGIIPAPEYSDTETAAKLLEMYDGKELTAEITFVSGDSVMVNLFHDSGETKQSVADTLVNLRYAVPQLKSRDDARRVSVSDEGKIVYNYPNYGDVHTVCLISVTSPSDFWCQLENGKTELKSMSKRIELFYDSLGENDLRLHFLQDGDVCCAKFAEDDKWYRSLVDKVCSDGQVSVRSVDYAKQETLTLDRIKKLEAAFAVLPVQAVNCSLSSIEPPHKYYGEEWSSEAVERFKELGKGKELKINVKGQEGNIVLVELLSSTGLSVADQLVSEQLAVERKLPLTVSPLKGTEKQLKSLSISQVEKALEQSSEEDVFQEAESSVEGVLELSEGKESNEEDEEEFHDSSDQFTSEEKSKSSAALENEEGDLQTAESSVEEKYATPLEEAEVQGSDNLQSSDEQPAESSGEVIEEKPALTADEVQESSVRKEAKSEAEIVLGEQKEAETEAQSSEKIKVSEQVDSMGNEDRQNVIPFAGEVSEKADDKGEKELTVDKANETAASQNEEEVGNTRDVDLSETTKVVKTKVEHEETKTEQEHVSSSASEKQSEKEVGETSNMDIYESSVAKHEETKTEQEHVSSSVSEKQSEEEVGEKSNMDICESSVAKHEDTKTEQEHVTSFASEKQSEEEAGKSSNMDVCESSIGEQVKTCIQQEHISAAAPEEQSKEEVGRASNKDICKTTIAEQEHVTCEASEEQSEEEAGNSSSIDTCETTEAGGSETKIEQELVSAAASDEQDEKEYQGEGETGSPETALGQVKAEFDGPVSLEEKGDGLGTVLDGSSVAKEKEDELMVEGSVNNNDSSVSEDIVDGEGNATCSMGGPNNSVTEEQEGPMEDEHLSADTIEQKEDCEKFAEDQEGVTEAFSEEDLTAIIGSAEDGTEATEENKSDEERVSSPSPAYIPPSSPAVFIQPGGEVQFTKDQSPGKETQDS